jgi:hypothetical protein
LVQGIKSYLFMIKKAAEKPDADRLEKEAADRKEADRLKKETAATATSNRNCDASERWSPPP